MGQTLDRPEISKETISASSGFLSYGCSAMQGYRLTMEDQHSTDEVVEIKGELKDVIENGEEIELAFFGVYDGHSGSACAKYLSQHLLTNTLNDELVYRSQAKGQLLSDDSIIQKSFLRTDEEFARSINNSRPDSSGTTCTSVFIVRHKDQVEIICNNVGDSRTVLRRQDGKVEPLSQDHKPTNQPERERIIESGGFVEFGRVNGSLALSRAFGDMGYKGNANLPPDRQAVIAKPDIKRVKLQLTPIDDKKDNFEFIILACDGIWDVMSNEQACQFVFQKLKEQRDKKDKYYEDRLTRILKQNEQQQSDLSPEGIEKQREALKETHDKRRSNVGTFDLESVCEDLLDECVLRLDSKDNVSVIIVLFDAPS